MLNILWLFPVFIILFYYGWDKFEWLDILNMLWKPSMHAKCLLPGALCQQWNSYSHPPFETSSQHSQCSEFLCFRGHIKAIPESANVSIAKYFLLFLQLNTWFGANVKTALCSNFSFRWSQVIILCLRWNGVSELSHFNKRIEFCSRWFQYFVEVIWNVQTILHCIPSNSYNL